MEKIIISIEEADDPMRDQPTFWNMQSVLENCIILENVQCAMMNRDLRMAEQRSKDIITIITNLFQSVGSVKNVITNGINTINPSHIEESRNPPKMVSISFSAGSRDHARISVLRGAEKAWKESEADYFSRSLDCVAKYDQSSSSWRMYRPLLQEVAPEWSEKLPRWGMIVDGALYPLQALEPCTDESAGSYWPTPKARDYRDSGESPGDRRRHSPSLPCVVKTIMSENMMGTPTTSQANKPIRKPTPSSMKGKHGENLQDSIGRLNPEMIGKKLSVTFVELMMGYPIGWSDLKRLVIL